MITDSGINAAALEAQKRSGIFLDMESTVKELVNILLPADYLLRRIEQGAEHLDAGADVTIKRGELHSIAHLVGQAHAVAEKLRSIVGTAKTNVEDVRPREEGWRKDPREALRQIKSV